MSVLGTGLSALKGRGFELHEDRKGLDPRRLMEAARFEAVVYFFAYHGDGADTCGPKQGAWLDQLNRIRRAAEHSGAERFVLVTDRRAFGRTQPGGEDEIPEPDTAMGVMIRTAEECLRLDAQDPSRALVIRVTNLYPQDGCLFTSACAACKKGEPLRLDGTPDTLCDLLHADDLAIFISRALDAGLTGAVHLAGGAGHTYGELAALFGARMPGLKVIYTQAMGRRASLMVGAAKALDWVPRHDFAREIDEMTCGLDERRRVSELAELAARAGRALGGVLPWAELAALAGIAWALDSLTQSEAAFRRVDFWLLYAALMGATHGGHMGLAAALVACVAYAIRWVGAGNEAYILLYNTDNWLPPVSYLLAGALFGHLRDAQRQREQTIERERQAREIELQQLNTLYRQAYEDRDRLLEQIAHNRDSYGRIYHITQALDTVQPEQIFLSTLRVVEEIMQNRSVAIYTRDDRALARLIVYSREMEQPIRSLDLNALPRLKEALEQGRLFTNAALEQGYPAYAAPIGDVQEGAAVIMLWTVPFEKRTLYYENLLNVVAGLTRSAMARAVRYVNLSGDMYIAGTHILTDRAFRSALDAYRDMSKQKNASFLLVRVEARGALSPRDMDERIARSTRSTDLVGRLEDGEYRVLLPQADAEEMPLVRARFAGQGLSCEPSEVEVAVGA